MKVVLCGYYGMGNGGDEALLASLLQMLPATAKPVVLSGNPDETTERYGVEAQPRKSVQGIWAAFSGAEAFIWGGGSLMQDTTSAMNPLYYGGLMWLAQTLRLQTIAWAQGIGPLERRWTRRLTRNLLSRCAGVTVRDRVSAAQVASWRVNSWLAPDPVWALESIPVPGLADFPAPRIAVALRSHPSLTETRLAQLGQALASFQIATGTTVLLVPFQPTKDLLIAQRIAPYLKGNYEILSVGDPRQLKGIFRGVEMAIAMRLHGLVMAAAEGCRCFALSYDPKVTYFAEDLDIPGWEMTSSKAASTSPDFALSPWPESSAEMTKALLTQYADGLPASPDQIQSRIDRALMHRDLLSQLLDSRQSSQGIPSRT
ncbi:polysaccharide pyruvyl transferase CsaB [Oscillatoria sp. CS-180]|uniref:polysaccharide pyruvyl transferase CsaB n=1 Tax=Oscillatoria sp. CS-180 TaxID=3021720 RepID=UPI00232C45DB|nr:polysaccharide pyruvyl transferase CsaB [Oscillatoria sp. CS-180]MDB9528742.1 polysaccharide pyruvyl transferase CsaB [Oscillatoria sp. CS-180]